MALNLGRMRGDNTGSQDTILNSIKPQKTAFPHFTGKNADELNALAQFIEDKIASANEYGKDLTSKNVDTTLERMHTLMLKLKDASDSDNTTAYEKLQAQIISQVKEIMVQSESDKPKETILSDEDKEYIKELIAASTLTEATEKTEDQTGENGLTQDDINKALDKTITQQKILNDDVVAAAEKAKDITEDTSQSSDDVKAELAEMFKDSSSDEAIGDMSKTNATQFQKLQDLVNGHVGRLNALFGTFGDNFKNSPLFNYKNPFTSAVGNIPNPLKGLDKQFGKLKKTFTSPFTKLRTSLGNIKDSVTSPFKSLNAKLTNMKESFAGSFKKLFTKKKKKKPAGGFLASLPLIGKFFQPKPETSKEKKEKKKTSKLFDSIGKFMKKINDIIKNIVQHILDIISQIVIGLCKAIAKGIGIILRAIFLSPWGLIILASLLLISIGILLISLAVKKLVDYIVDDLGPIIKEKLKMINPEALNNFLDKVSKFIDVFSSILAGAFAPLIAIGTIIKNAIGPIGKVIAKIAEVLGKILVPVIEAIGEVIMILMKPILLLLKVVALAIQKILMVMMPIIEAVLNLIVQIYKYVIAPLIKLVIAIIVPILKIIGALINGIIKIVKPIFDLIMAVIMPAIDIIVAIVKGIIAIVKPIVDFLMVVLKAAIDIIVAVVQAIMAIVQPILDVIMGVIKIVVLGIQAAVKVIQKIVGFVRKIIRKIFNAFMHPIKFVTSLIKGIGNWLAKFADFEIGFWKFKFKPLSFLKGLKSDDTGSGDDEDEEDENEDNGDGNKEVQDKLKEQIEELNKKMELQVQSLDKLKDKFDTAMQTARPLAWYLMLRTKLNSKLLKDEVMPELEDIHDILKWTGSRRIIEKLEEVQETSNKAVEEIQIQSEKLGILDDIKEQADHIAELIENMTNNELLDKLYDISDQLKDYYNDMMDKFDDVMDEVRYCSKYQTSMFGGGKFKRLLGFVSAFKRRPAPGRDKDKKDLFGILKSIKKKTFDMAKKPLSVFSKVKGKVLSKAKSTQANVFSKAKSMFNFGKKVAGKAAPAAKTAFKFTPAGFAASMFPKFKKAEAASKKAAFYHPNKKVYSTEEKGILSAAQKFISGKMSNAAKDTIQPAKTDIKIAQQSVQEQFKPIRNVDAVNSSKMKNVSEDLDEIKAEEAASRKDKDITNMDLKNFLTTMFENVDENFFQINKKLDEPNLMPMPMSMNINNQALLGAN